MVPPDVAKIAESDDEEDDDDQEFQVGWLLISDRQVWYNFSICES